MSREVVYLLINLPSLLVRENVTLVRRDANEEKVIIAYFVPTAADYDIAKMKEWLRSKLPVYSVPAGTAVWWLLRLAVPLSSIHAGPVQCLCR